MSTVQIRDAEGNDRTWPFVSSTPTLKRLETAFRASLGLGGRLKDHKASLEATRRFTAAGVDAEAAKFVRREVLPSIVKGHIALAAARRHAKDTWSRLKPKAPDKADTVAFF